MILLFVMEEFTYYGYHTCVVSGGYTYSVCYLGDPHLTMVIHVDSYKDFSTTTEQLITVTTQ